MPLQLSPPPPPVGQVLWVPAKSGCLPFSFCPPSPLPPRLLRIALCREGTGHRPEAQSRSSRHRAWGRGHRAAISPSLSRASSFISLGGKWALQAAPASVTALSFSPDGALALAVGNGNIELWDPSAASGPARTSTLLAHTGSANAVKWTPDGRAIASGGDDGVVRIFTPPSLSPAPSQSACPFTVFSVRLTSAQGYPVTAAGLPTADDCRDLCDATPSCDWWSFWAIDNLCYTYPTGWLLSATAGPGTSAPKSCSFEKITYCEAGNSYTVPRADLPAVMPSAATLKPAFHLGPCAGSCKLPLRLSATSDLGIVVSTNAEVCQVCAWCQIHS